ncbi:MAG: ImmA/IrrE family metallo-endopeptidase [Candidatus Zixiibacteriota bacterium]
MAKATIGQERIEKRVAKILGDFGVDSPPIPVERIARKLGAAVRKEPYEGDLSGVLYRRAGECVIGVNNNDNGLRQRFTVAHEIGHLVLHDGSIYIDRKYAGELAKPAETESGKRFFRDKVSSMATDPHEIEANRFAAALLMPQDLLFADIEKRSISVPIRSLTDIKPLASRYRVSLEAMVFRLINLGVPVETA